VKRFSPPLKCAIVFVVSLLGVSFHHLSLAVNCIASQVKSKMYGTQIGYCDTLTRKAQNRLAANTLRQFQNLISPAVVIKPDFPSW